MGLDDIDLIELNEAFAAQSLAVTDEWGIDAEDERLNANGGAIALGHPLGCSGARLLTTMLHELQRRDDAQLGLATMCIGVGQGIAMVVETDRLTNARPVGGRQASKSGRSGLREPAAADEANGESQADNGKPVVRRGRKTRGLIRR